MESNFLINPLECYSKNKVEIEIYHSSTQKDLISTYEKQYGLDLVGLTRIVFRANMNRLYRSAKIADSEIMFEPLNTEYNKRSKLKLIA